jgi:flavin reductase (DIM6/NTAB) family NADH-FMN oxidoreductase RutF
MHIDLSELSPSKTYFTFIQTLIPRPVAWVLSENSDRGFNLAPFSYFNAVCSDPPLVMLSIGKKVDGSLKDTRRNIVERKHFVVHIAHREMAPMVTASSRELAENDSELTQLGLQTVPFGNFPVPRLSDCRIAFACRFYQQIDTVATVDAGRLTVDAAKVNPLARLGGDEYSTIGDVLKVPRPR